MIKEFCAENLTDLAKLDPKDIQRVELCDNLALGGTTPSYGVIKEANRYLHEKGMTTSIMIRPRGGDYVYNDLELRAMEEDILQAVALESDALVLGLLTKDNLIDQDALEQLLPATQGIPLVFHRAFDSIPADHQKEAMDQLIDLGFSRILLHGSKEDNTILENVKHLKELITYADNRIDIMLAGGITPEIAEQLCQETGAKQVHGTRLA